MKNQSFLLFVILLTSFLLSSCKNLNPNPKGDIKVVVSYHSDFTYMPGTTCTGSYLRNGYVSVTLYKSGSTTALANQTSNGNSTIDFGSFDHGNYYVTVIGNEDATNYCSSYTYTNKNYNIRNDFTLNSSTLTINIAL